MLTIAIAHADAHHQTLAAAQSLLIICVHFAGPAAGRDQAPASQDRGMLQPSSGPRVTTDNASAAVMGDSSSSIVACGVTAHMIETLAPHGSMQVTMQLLPLCQGVQQLSGLALQGTDDSRMYDKIQPMEVLVHA